MMKKPDRESGIAPKSIYAASDFTHELFENLVSDRYSLAACQIFLSRAWLRSLEDIRKVPTRTRSFVNWAIVGVGIGIAIILLTLSVHGVQEAVTATALWVPWYALTVGFVLTHLGMVDDEAGCSHTSLLLPNALSFARLGLAPLVIWPCLHAPVNPVSGPVFALFLAMLALTDVLDGWLARRRNAATRMGRMLDSLADSAFLTFLAVGLYTAGILATPLFALLIARYCGLPIVVLLLYFVRGPAPLQPTIVGKATGLAANVVLLVLAFTHFLQSNLLPVRLLEWSAYGLYVLIVVNIFHLLRHAAKWNKTGI